MSVFSRDMVEERGDSISESSSSPTDRPLIILSQLGNIVNYKGKEFDSNFITEVKRKPDHHLIFRICYLIAVVVSVFYFNYKFLPTTKVEWLLLPVFSISIYYLAKLAIIKTYNVQINYKGSFLKVKKGLNGLGSERLFNEFQTVLDKRIQRES